MYLSFRVRALPLVACVAFAALTSVTFVTASASADTPTRKVLYEDGQTDRYLMDGQWSFRKDDAGVGLRQGFQRAKSNSGWTPVSVPNAWNANDDTEASMRGGVGWYKKDFSLPSSDKNATWVIRFESVNYRARVWLNGTPVGSNAGAYLPFEVTLRNFKRTGTNHLVVRVDSRRRGDDLPPQSISKTGTPGGGWWNYGGILREVYLRKIDRVGFENVAVQPKISCRTCTANIGVSVTMRNYTGQAQSVNVRARYGSKTINLGKRTIGARRTETYNGRTRIPHPKLWELDSPNLYQVSLAASAKKGKKSGQVATYKLKSGIRSVRVSGGRFELNFEPVQFKGVGLHEDSPGMGAALNSAERQKIVQLTQQLGGKMLRSHYPLHPEIHELADKLGLMIWSEVPVYQVKSTFIAKPALRRRAVEVLTKNIETNQNHASVALWSVANELASKPGPSQGNFLRKMVSAAKRLDPTRPQALAVAGYVSAGCQREYGPLKVIGFNEYFGWYVGPGGQIADRRELPAYLDQVRDCYPNKAIFVSEFGVEANRDGPVEEKGTFQFQQDWINYQVPILSAKTWLSGQLYWALREFKVRPAWEGGNPRPSPPGSLHQKGLVSYDGRPKPAFFDLQRMWREPAATPAP